jgi:hypothetical protein
MNRQNKKYHQLSDSLRDVLQSKKGRQKPTDLIEMLFDDALFKAILSQEKIKSVKAVIKSIWGLDDTTLDTCDVCRDKDIVAKVKFEAIKEKVNICGPCLDKIDNLIRFILKTGDEYAKNKLA